MADHARKDVLPQPAFEQVETVGADCDPDNRWHQFRDGESICICGETEFGDVGKPQPAFEQVIAEMREALMSAERVMTDADIDHEPEEDEAQQALGQVRAAIAKADRLSTLSRKEPEK